MEAREAAAVKQGVEHGAIDEVGVARLVLVNAVGSEQAPRGPATNHTDGFDACCGGCRCRHGGEVGLRHRDDIVDFWILFIFYHLVFSIVRGHSLPLFTLQKSD